MPSPDSLTLRQNTLLVCRSHPGAVAPAKGIVPKHPLHWATFMTNSNAYGKKLLVNVVYR